MAATIFSHQILGAIFLLFLVLQPFAIKARPLQLQSLLKLEGAQGGDVVKGLNQVKQYLKAFGYVHLNNDDRFDDSLESALKSYQQRFHLKVSGQLDRDTITTMATPRCGGFLDGDDPNHESNFKFQFVSNYSFFQGAPRWNRYSLTYNFVSGVQVYTVQQLSPVIARAFSRWAAVSPFRFTQAAQNTRADIRIGFFRGDHGDGAPFTGPGGVVAHAFAPSDGRFHYDADESWSPNPSSNSQVDLEAVAVHEIGHNLGLGHSDDTGAIMYPFVQNYKRELGQDDINGLQALYRY